MEPNWKDKLMLHIWSIMPQLVITGLILLAIGLFTLGWLIS